MKNQIPLSEKAKLSLRRGRFNNYDFNIVWVICVFLLSFMVLPTWISGGPEAITTNPTFQLLRIMYLILIPGGIAFIIYRRFKIKRKVFRENRKDYQLSRQVYEATEYLKQNPPDLKEVNFSKAQELKGLRAVRIEYFPQRKIEGMLSGKFIGWGLFAIRGEISGKLMGESTPDLVNQNILMICAAENGDSVRLICPSMYVLRENLMRYFTKLAGEYGTGGYTYRALRDLWQGPNGLREMLKELNPNRIYDFLVTKLELPLKQRPTISVKGMSIQEGVFLPFLIKCKGKEPGVVIPIDLISKTRELLEERLKRSIPIGPLTTELELVR